MSPKQPWPEHLLIVRATVAARVEVAWNRWYNEVHLPEITACPGFIASRRYVTEGPGGRSYVAIYALTGPEALVSAEFAARRGWSSFRPDVAATVELYRAIEGGQQP